MAQNTSIEWTEQTWNPVRGCTKISPGCKHCYAAVFAERWRGIPGHPYEQGFDLLLVPEKLDEPLNRKKPTIYFVNSMSDLFHQDVPTDYIMHVFHRIAIAPRHTFQILTKRAERMESAMTILSQQFPALFPMKNAWLGVSVDDRKHGIPRIEHLQRTPAALRFLSIEPLLEDLGEINLMGIDWVIVGGESGNGARPMSIDWVRSVRDQCQAAGVKFFFKQWGGVKKKETGRILDGRTWDEIPEVAR